MKTIMHVVQSPGGVERYLQSLIKYTDRNEYKIILVCSRDYDIELFSHRVDSIEVVDMGREIDPINDFKAILKIRKLINRYSPDFLYAHSSKAGALGRVACIGVHCKCIYNAHGWAFNMRCSSKKKRIYILAERMLAHLCDRIVVISDYEKNSALRYRICKEDKLQVIYNGIDFSEYENETAISRNTLGIPEDAVVVGFIGRLSEQKAPDVFVKAASLIRKSCKKAYFVMVGDGDLRKEVEDLAAKEGISDVLFITGWISSPMQYLQIFDVAVLLSRWEGFGLVLAEYMLARKPIVATRVDAIPNLIDDGVNGLLVEVDDYESAANSVLRILNDNDLRSDLVENGYNVVCTRFDVRRVVSETESMLHSLEER